MGTIIGEGIDGDGVFGIGNPNRNLPGPAGRKDPGYGKSGRAQGQLCRCAGRRSIEEARSLAAPGFVYLRFVRVLMGALAGFPWAPDACRTGSLEGFLGAALGGGEPWPPDLGGKDRIRHLGPEPMRFSRWAFSRASRTRA